MRHLPRVHRQHYRGKKLSQDSRVIGLSSAQRRRASTAVSPAGLPPSTSSRKSGRHSDTATLASAASLWALPLPGTKVSWRYAGGGSLRLGCHSPQPGHRRSCFKRHSAGDGSPCFARGSLQLRHYSGDRSLRLACRSFRPWHGRLRIKRRPCQTRPSPSRPCGGGRFGVREGRHLNLEI